VVSPADQDEPTKPQESVPPKGRAITVVQGRIDSRDLFVGTREITIGHGNDVYRLRLTSQNKLILTK
jgi:hemin uptake protein HemP